MTRFVLARSVAALVRSRGAGAHRPRLSAAGAAGDAGASVDASGLSMRSKICGHPVAEFLQGRGAIRAAPQSERSPGTRASMKHGLGTVRCRHARAGSERVPGATPFSDACARGTAPRVDAERETRVQSFARPVTMRELRSKLRRTDDRLLSSTRTRRTASRCSRTAGRARVDATPLRTATGWQRQRSCGHAR